MKKAKTSIKVAIASALALSSTAAVIYAAPKIIQSASTGAETRVYLDVEKVNSDTVKVSLDNIEDIAKSIQFSIKLDDSVKIKKDENGEYLIKDLLAEEVDERLRSNEYKSGNSIITDYTYNEDTNTVDVLITAEESLPKVENKIDIFTLGIEAKSNDNKRFNIIPEDADSYKYVAVDNKEYSNLAVEYDDSLINLNTAPKVEYTGKEINIYDGQELVFDKIEGLTESDEDKGDDVTLEVRNITNVDENREDSQPLITKFATDDVGAYTFKINAVDSMGEKSKPVEVVVNVAYDLNLPEPTIEGVENVELQSGSVFNTLDGVSAKDAKGRNLDVEVTGELNLDPEEDKTYQLTYSATDRYGKKTTETRNVAVKANKAPTISGVEDKVINIGDKFDEKNGVQVTDDRDKDLTKDLVVTGSVNNSIAGEYKIAYSVTDSGKKTTRAQRTVRVNRSPIVSGNDSTLVVSSNEELTDKIILGGINITDETDYDVNVDIPNIEGEGNYEATITVTDKDNGVTEVKRNIVVSDKSVAELPNSGEGTSVNDAKSIQVVDKEGIDLLNKELSAATKDYKVTTTKKKFTGYTEYNFEISKKEAVFRNSDNIYVKVKVPDSVEETTGGISITEYKEVLAESVTIDNKADLNHYIKKGDEVKLQATINPSNVTNKELDWTSSNDEVVEIVKDGDGVKAVAKEYGIATIKVGAKDGSDKYDEFTFDVAHNIIELPDDVNMESGEGTESSPLVYSIEKLESLQEILDNSKNEFNSVLQDKKVINENTVEYSLKLEEKGILKRLVGNTKTYYITLRVPNNNDFEEVVYKLDKHDTKAPTFSYTGDTQIVLEKGADFTIPEVKATDNLDKDIVVTHTIKNTKRRSAKSIDTSVVGEYIITYTAEDSSKNKSTLEINVVVKEAEVPQTPPVPEAPPAEKPEEQPAPPAPPVTETPNVPSVPEIPVVPPVEEAPQAPKPPVLPQIPEEPQAPQEESKPEEGVKPEAPQEDLKPEEGVKPQAPQEESNQWDEVKPEDSQEEPKQEGESKPQDTQEEQKPEGETGVQDSKEELKPQGESKAEGEAQQGVQEKPQEQSQDSQNKPQDKQNQEVIDKKDNSLPETGGRNSLIIVGIGAAIASIGGLLFNKKNKKR